VDNVKDSASVDAVPTIKVPGNTHFKTNMDQQIRLSRRSLLLGAAATTTALRMTAAPLNSARGREGQRKPDQGNGTYLNPVMAGDHPEPSLSTDEAGSR
jgi:hypothetical protein